ncbi:hypothetical protein ACHQM5_020105 [Ranunculus cassubicifolius]
MFLAENPSPMVLLPLDTTLFLDDIDMPSIVLSLMSIIFSYILHLQYQISHLMSIFYLLFLNKNSTISIANVLIIQKDLLQDADKCYGKSKGLLQSFKDNTWSEAYNGLGISLLLTSNPSIQYTIFDQLKRRLLKRNETKNAGTLSAFSAFMLGALSKSIATCLTYPTIRYKVTIQAADPDDDETNETLSKPPKTIMNAVYTIWKREGLMGFFKGLIKEKITKTTWVLMLAIRQYVLLTRSRLKSS